MTLMRTCGDLLTNSFTVNAKSAGDRQHGQVARSWRAIGVATPTESDTISLAPIRGWTCMSLQEQPLRLDYCFEQQALRTPDRVAVLDGGTENTVAELKASRSAERRVGTEWVRTGRERGWRD